MASDKVGVNLIFALVVAALGLTAGASAYLNRNQPHIPSAPAQEEPAGRLPENVPQIDAMKRLAALEQMSAKDPANAGYLAQIANAYYDLGEYGKAADFYQKSLKIQPRDPHVETDFATCLQYMGRHEEALEILNRILDYSPNFPQAMFNKGIVLAADGNDIQGGIAVWEDLLRLHPEFSRSAGLEQKIKQLRASAK
jgi:tetratricopeptide (TPR) repeat protein